MKRQRNFDIFSLSLLDVVSCGFGAIVMLLLISRSGDPQAIDTIGGEDTMTALIELQQANDQRKAALGRAQGLNDSTKAEIASLQAAIGLLQKKSQEQMDLADDLYQANSGLQAEVIASAQALKSKSSKAASVKEVGGIPVDADYVVFVVDTSGSMQSIWPRVMAVMDDIIKIHPQVKGIQILSDMGRPLVFGYHGRWMPDTPQMRNLMRGQLARWREYSNSNPTEGIQEAIRTYCKPDKNVAIYVFADDFIGSADAVIANIKAKGGRFRGKQPSFRIHGIVFETHTGPQVANFMRHLTAAFDGSLISVN